MTWNFWKSLSVLVLGMAALLQDYEKKETITTLVAKVDYPCILKTWRILGVMVCMVGGSPNTCLIVENAYPCGIFEVVRRPGTTHLAEMPPILAKLPVTSSHTGELQFAEARVYTFIPPLPFETGLPIAKPEGQQFAVNYVSEADAFLWRADWLDSLLSFPGCGIDREAGGWGSYTPRSGFAVQANEVIAAHLQGLRAGRAANRPDGHLVFSRYPFEPRTGHYVQPIHPKLRPCLPIGGSVARTERDNLSKEGAYFNVHFGIFVVCQGCFPPVLAPARPPID